MDFIDQRYKKGEELSYDYGFSYDEDYKQFPCKCGTKKCCGYIVREGSRWRINKKYRKKILIGNFFPDRDRERVLMVHNISYF